MPIIAEICRCVAGSVDGNALPEGQGGEYNRAIAEPLQWERKGWGQGRRAKQPGQERFHQLGERDGGAV